MWRHSKFYLIYSFIFFLIFLNVYLFLRERDRVQGEEGQRDRETLNLKQAPGSGLLAVSTEPDAGPEPMNREIVT